MSAAGIKRIEDFLSKYSRFGKPVTNLSRFSALCEKIGNPQNTLKFIHIVGTNGKGSVAEFCPQSLSAAGYFTGKFTSPYVIDVCERISVCFDGKTEKISCEDFMRCAETVSKAAEQCDNYRTEDFSQFEILNAIAFLYYKEIKADFVVLEAGIGGTLDSTNVIPMPVAAVITSIGLDHTKILGDTLEKIAAAKCGIIKGGTAVCASDIPNGALEVIKTHCRQTGAVLVIPEKGCLEVKKQSVSGSEFCYKGVNYRLKMPGEFQIQNALTAIETLTAAGIDSRFIAKGLESSSIPARTELLNGNLLLDGGHNPQAAQALKKLLLSSEIPCKTAVIGMSNTKDFGAFLSVILPCFERAAFCDGFSEGAVPAEALKAAAGERFRDAPLFHNACEALNWAKNFPKEKLVFLGGSFYFAAAVRQLISADFRG